LQLLGDLHADTAESFNNVANVRSALKQHSEALDLYKRYVKPDSVSGPISGHQQ
jgi:hypothetical protein